MDIKLLKTDILSNNIPKFLIFAEYEHALCKQYITSIANTLNMDYLYFDTADEVIYFIETGIHSDFVFIIYNDDKVLSNKFLIDKLVSLNKYIIIVTNSVDKSTDVYKEYKDNHVVFDKLDKYTILAYITKLCSKNSIDVSQDKLMQLIQYCDEDLSAVLNELDKIITLGQSNSNVLFSYMLENGFSDYRDINTFKFINKVANKDYTAFDDLYKINDSPVSIIFNLYNIYKTKLTTSKDMYYANCMKTCSNIYNSIIDGTMSDKYAIKCLMLEVLL